MTDVFAQPDRGAPIEQRIKRDRFGRYLLPNPDNNKEMAWTRATTLAKTLSDTFALSRRGERMVASGIGKRPDLYALAIATPVTDADMLDSLAQQAKDAASASMGANLGSAHHSFTEAVDRGQTVNVPAQWAGDIAAYEETMKSRGIAVVPEYIERIVVCPSIGIAGKLDRLVSEQNREILTVADLKTAKRVDYSFLEIAIQLALYAHAELMWNEVTQEYEPMPEVDKRRAIVMHLPVEQRKCTLHEVNVEEGWRAVQTALEVREWRKRKDLLAGYTTPALAANGAQRGAQAATHVRAVEGLTVSAKLDPDRCQTCATDGHACIDCGTRVHHDDVMCYACRIATATTRKDLSEVWKLANGRGEWTDALELAGYSRVNELDMAARG